MENHNIKKGAALAICQRIAEVLRMLLGFLQPSEIAPFLVVGEWFGFTAEYPIDEYRIGNYHR